MDWKTCFAEKKILIAEDDALNRELMSDIFATMSCIPDFAFDGEIAVQKFKTQSYHLIFMDIQMPKKDGITATKEIRQHEKTTGQNRIPILALTASILDQDKRNCLAAGIDDFVSKPIHLTELRTKMAKYLLENTLQ